MEGNTQHPSDSVEDLEIADLKAYVTMVGEMDKLGVKVREGDVERLDTLLDTEGDPGFNDSPPPQLHGPQTLVMAHNMAGMHSEWALGRYWATRRELGAGVVCLTDHRLPELSEKSQHFLARRAMGRGASGVWTSGVRGEDGLYVGGCAVLVSPALASRVVRKIQDESGLGRFCAIQLRGSGGKLVTIVATYNAPNGSAMLAKQRLTLGRKDAQVAH